MIGESTAVRWRSDGSAAVRGGARTSRGPLRVVLEMRAGKMRFRFLVAWAKGNKTSPKLNWFLIYFYFLKKKDKRAAAGIRCALGLGCPLGQQKRTKKKNKANQKKAAAQLGTHGFHCVFSLPLWWLATNLRCVISSRPCSSDFWLYVHANSYEAHE